MTKSFPPQQIEKNMGVAMTSTKQARVLTSVPEVSEDHTEGFRQAMASIELVLRPKSFDMFSGNLSFYAAFFMFCQM